MDCLEKSQAQMKEYQTLQKKLQSRRQDYDAKLAKVQKAKKEKPEWEEEMQAAKAKYEETRENVLNLMTSINESQVRKKLIHASSAQFANIDNNCLLFVYCSSVVERTIINNAILYVTPTV